MRWTLDMLHGAETTHVWSILMELHERRVGSGDYGSRFAVRAVYI